MFSGLFNRLFTWSNYGHEKDRINTYLSESVSLIDLEIRQRKIDRGEAPWQNNNIQLFNGWN